MKTIIVGDLHGNHEVVDSVLATGLPVIFVGDYVDSYTRSRAEQKLTLTKVLDAVEAGQAQGLRGNHEMSYRRRELKCSGYGSTIQYVMGQEKPRIDTLLKDYIWHEGFLITHAGVSELLLNELDKTIDQYLEEGNFGQIGVRRGGSDAVGGLWWCDFRHEFEPIKDVPQIFGHTRGTGIRKKGNSYCIDCIESPDTKQVLLIENKKAEVAYIDNKGVVRDHEDSRVIA